MSVPRIWPGRALARALLVPALLSLGVFVSEATQPVVLVLDLVVALVAAADLASLRGAGRFRVVRQCGTTCSLGQPQQVTLALENMTRRGRRLRRLWVRWRLPRGRRSRWGRSRCFGAIGADVRGSGSGGRGGAAKR